MITTILFDADGVLIGGEMFSYWLEKEYDISREKTLPFFTGIFQECLVGGADLKTVLVPYLAQWRWKRSVDEFINYWFTCEHSINQDLIAYIQVLRKQGIMCALATNQEKYRFQYMLETMEFSRSFDRTFASAHIGSRKPEAGFFNHIAEDLHVPKEQVLLWDDSKENVAAAREFGFQAERYTTFEDFKTTMAKYVKIGGI